MPNKAVMNRATLISSVAQSIAMAFASRELPKENIYLNQFALFLYTGASLDVLDSTNICVGLSYIQTIYEQISLKLNDPQAPDWIKNHKQNTIFNDTDELICVTAMMLAHKGTLGEDIPFDTHSFSKIYSLCVNSDHPFYCDRLHPQITDQMLLAIMKNYHSYSAPDAERMAFQILARAKLSLEETRQHFLAIMRGKACLTSIIKMEMNILELLDFHLPNNPNVINHYAIHIFKPEKSISLKRFNTLLPAQYDPLPYPPADYQEPEDPHLYWLKTHYEKQMALSEQKRRAIVLAEQGKFSTEQQQQIAAEYNSRSIVDQNVPTFFSATTPPPMTAEEEAQYQATEIADAKKRNKTWSP